MSRSARTRYRLASFHRIRMTYKYYQIFVIPVGRPTRMKNLAKA
jgi:hypothetical protein